MHQLHVTEEEIAKAVRSLSRGAAPAMDGWTRELMIPIIEDPEALMELTIMMDDLLNGITSDEVKRRLMAAPLIALSKPTTSPSGQGGIRPIAIESAIIKVLSKVALTKVSETTWKEVFPGNLQFGAGPSASVEAAIRNSRLFLKLAGKATLVDAENAFNTLSRDIIVQKLAKSPGLAPIYRLAAWSLNETPLLLIDGGRTISHMTSQCGVRQGSVLGPILFALGIHHILLKIANTCEVKLVAYLDDITLFGDPTKVEEAFHILETELAKIGLRVNRVKTTHLSEIGKIERLLGAAAWLSEEQPTEAITDFVMKQIKKHDKFFDTLKDLSLKKSTKLHLLQCCGQGRVTFLIRNHPPDTAMNAACHFDTMQESVLKQLVGDDAMLSDIASIPTRMGGLGLRCASDLAEIAWSATTGANAGAGAQRIATSEIDEVKYKGIIATMSGRDRQVFTSQRKAGFGLCRSADEAFVTHLRDRLFLPIATPGTKCICKADVTAAHIHTCPSLGAARIRRHDMLKKLLSTYAARTYTVREEPSRLLSKNRCRPDLQILAPDGHISVDVSVTYAGLQVGDPLGARVKEKRAKYASLQDDANGSVFVPFVMASTGELDSCGTQLLRRLLPRTNERSAARLELRDALIVGNWGLLRAAIAGE